ncbi:hypothetical protein BJ875DRAFT_270963 [Amylocarpus encephaloides]|uniref:Uncharacterized protein n=1 Tax=Amylocarpus encephaloides TaxID=45428 RepID=A0A9P7Y7W0_9HELO|nr:hypothetical protein BJ875DRAFT_270963 [Amylocarpus encephaloides]
MSLQAIQQAVSGIAPSRVFRVSITNVPAVVHRWIAANPGQSALLIANGILIFTPAALTGPLLATMGFGASGPIAGSVAAWLQSILGNVGARSVFAYLQSAAMGGYGVAAVNGIVQALGMISGAAVTAYNWPRRPNTRTSESTMPALSSTVLNSSDQDYQAMLTTEPLDTANIAATPTRDNADLYSARR